MVKDFNVRGVEKMNAGELTVACKLFEKFISKNPLHPFGYCNLGTAEAMRGNFKRAIYCYEKALKLNPNHPQIYNNYAKILTNMEKYDEAITLFKKSLRLDLSNGDTYKDMAPTLHRMGRMSEAIRAYKSGLSLKPSPESHSNLLLAMTYSDEHSAKEVYEESCRWADIYAREEYMMPLANPDLNPGRKLRIGYISADFRTHPVAYWLLKNIKYLDKNNFELFAYSNLHKGDEVTETLKGLFDHWLETPYMPDIDLANKIRQDGIDILIDLSGHTGNNRLTMFARKPAPIQCTWLGLIATTGMKQIDYYICDDGLYYPGVENFFSEKLLRIPDRLAAIDLPAVDVMVNSLPALETGRITFGAFGHLAKLSRESLELWAKIMHAVPNSVLYLKASGLESESIKNYYLELFFNLGIYPDRLKLEGRSPLKEYYQCYNKIDITLDPFPYNGGTTTNDTLWMGVPTITLAGEKMMSRVAASALLGAGYPEFITYSKEEYLKKAVALAGDLDKLAAIRSEMREKISASPLFDGPLIAKNFGLKMREIWREYCHSAQYQEYQPQTSVT